MAAKKSRRTRVGVFGVAIFALAAVLILPGNAPAITFGDWAAGQPV